MSEPVSVQEMRIVLANSSRRTYKMSEKVITNNVPRDVINAYELTDIERAEFDYLNWAKIDAGEDSASFFRYRGRLYDLGEFQTTSGFPEFSELAKWDGYMADSYFSATVVRYVDNCERIVCGMILS